MDTAAAQTVMATIDGFAEVANLDDDDSEVRCKALDKLGKLDISALVPHAAAIAAKLLHPNELKVRRAAEEVLHNLQRELLDSQQGRDVMASQAAFWLESHEPNLRKWAVETLGKLTPSQFAVYATAIVAKLEDSDWRVQKAALAQLGKLDSALLAQHAAALLKLDSSDVDGKVRIAGSQQCRDLSSCSQRCSSSALPLLLPCSRTKTGRCARRHWRGWVKSR